MNYYNRIAGQRIGRIEGLSDGVFSIAMTFLVFNLKDPMANVIATDAELCAALVGIFPSLLTFFLSFMTLGIFWTGHSTQFTFIEKSDRRLNWISLFFLMFVAILPFTTSILSAHIENKVSIAVYWANLFALGIMLLIHWKYAKQNKLSSPEHLVETDKAITKRIVIAQSLYALGALLCFVNTYLSIFVIIAIQLNYAFGIIHSKSSN